MEPQLKLHRPPLLPAYHEIVPSSPKYVYSTSSESIATQMAVLRDCHVIAQGGPPTATFDDAHRSQYEFGLPALQDHGIKGVFFAIPERAESWPDYMRWNELQELVRLGHEVQSHGFSHIPLTRCQDNDLKRELELSKSVLEDKLGTSVNAISIPFGRWDARVLRACRNAGYTRVYTSDPLPRTTKLGIELIGRFMVRNTMTSARFRELLIAKPASVMMMRVREAAKNSARRLMGDRNYHLLWCYLSGEDSELIKSEYV